MVAPPRARLSIVVALGLVALSLAVSRTLLAGAAALAMMQRELDFSAALLTVQQDLLIVGLCQLAGLAVALGVGVAVVHGAGARYREVLDVRPVPWALTASALIAGLALQLPLQEALNLLLELAPSLTPDAQTQRQLVRAVQVRGVLDAIVVPLAVVAIPAVFEELLFRGLLQPALALRYGRPLGLFAAAALFGIAHLTPLAIFYATAMGLLLGHVRDRTGSVMPPIAMHGAFNAVPVLLDPALVSIEGFNTVSTGVEHVPLALALASAFVAAAALTYLTRLTER